MASVLYRALFLDIPKVEWSFLDQARPKYRGSYQQLEGKSHIWVDKPLLAAAQAKAKSAKQYAWLLMWDVIVTPEEMLKAHAVKTPGIGFAKLFGKKNTDSVYRTLKSLFLSIFDLSNEQEF
jgi:hypothetical protein